MTACECSAAAERLERRSLRLLLVINGVMFLVEGAVGILAQSTALLADAVDMFADASVYALSLYAVGRRLAVKVRAARLSGILQILLGCTVLLDVLRRFLYGSEPQSLLMIAMGLTALAANVLCLVLLYRHRGGEVHMRASWIFSKNDVIANLGVITAGGLVAVLDSPYPDLLIGLVIVMVIIRGGLRIVGEAREAGRA